MAATGSEAVTLEQFKMLMDSGAGGKKYKITKSRHMPEYVKAEASPGEVVVTSVLGANNQYAFHVYEDAGNGSTGQIVEEGDDVILYRQSAGGCQAGSCGDSSDER